MAASKEQLEATQLKLIIETDAAEWAKDITDRGFCLPVGPVSSHVPTMFHRFLSEETLKSYIADNMTVGQELQRKFDPADIPVIVKGYAEEVYPQILENLNPMGKIALEKMHPWVLNTIIDWDNFDKIICKKTLRGVEEEDNSNILNKVDTSTGTQGTSVDNGSVVICKGEDGSTNKFLWSNSRVKKLIDMHTKYEDLFCKPGIKKMSVWKIICDEINKSEGIEGTCSSTSCSSQQCEQKWKNITKKFRDCVDHNSKSGNERKECPFFQELLSCYGYRPNVKPVYTASSSTGTASSSTGAACSSNVLCSKFNEDIDEKSNTEKNTSSNSSPIIASKRNSRKKDEVLSVLREIKDEIRSDQRKLLDVLEKQHSDRAKQEDKKLDMLATLISKVEKK